ncbi:MAG: hypothetical protein FJX73_10760 [Armatimonadetes bacterium]|nr:hypothetical protein [Armatimonadota bacterium]
MTRKKTTVYIDEGLLRLTKIAAVRTGKKEYQVVEEALRGHLGIEAVTRAWKGSELSEDEALALAYDELHASRE